MTSPIPEFWIGPGGQSMPTQIYAVWQMTYPVQALGWKPVFTADQFDAGIGDFRDRCIDIVATHGGSVEIEAAIRREPLVRVRRG
jgi:hypothetical protein